MHNFTGLKFKNIVRNTQILLDHNFPFIDAYSICAYLHKYKLKLLVVKVLFRSLPNKNVLTENRVLLLAAMRSRRAKWNCGQIQYSHSYEWSLHLETVAISACTTGGRQVPSRKSSASLHVLPGSLSGSFLFLSKAFSETSCVSCILLLTDTLLASNYHPHRSADRAVHLSTSKHF